MAGTVVEVEIPIDEFALRQTISELPSIDFEIERAVAHDADRVMPFVWVQSDEIAVRNLRQLLVTIQASNSLSWLLI